MSIVDDDSEVDVWSPPPDEECSEGTYPTALTGADPTVDRVKVRMRHHDGSGRLVEFAFVQQTFYKGKWRDVASADSCHITEAHLHWYGKRADARVGDPEHLMDIAGPDDVDAAYDLSYGRIIDRWAENKARWGNG
jgi:hypothetical protein